MSDKEKGKKEEIPEEEPEETEEEEQQEYLPNQKPELTEEERIALNIRRERKRKTPHFRRQEWFRYKRVGDQWRKPRGMHSKMRRNYKYRPKVVSKGFGGPKLAKGRHPSGFEEVMVYNHMDLEGLDPKRQAARIGHSVGYLKRMYIAIQAEEMGIRILNFNKQAHKDLLDEAKKRGIELPSREVNE